MDNKTEDLVKMAQRGDDNAFVELFSFYKESLYKIAFMYLKNEQDALDAINDTVYKAYTNIKKIKNPDLFKTWITRILINSAIDKLKKAKNVIYIDDYREVENLSISESELVLDAKFDLFNAIDNLDIKFKNIIILRYFQDMTISEIAALLKIPEGTVKVYLHRGLKKMKSELSKGCV